MDLSQVVLKKTTPNPNPNDSKEPKNSSKRETLNERWNQKIKEFETWKEPELLGISSQLQTGQTIIERLNEADPVALLYTNSVSREVQDELLKWIKQTGLYAGPFSTPTATIPPILKQESKNCLGLLQSTNDSGDARSALVSGIARTKKINDQMVQLQSILQSSQSWKSLSELSPNALALQQQQQQQKLQKELQKKRTASSRLQSATVR